MHRLSLLPLLFLGLLCVGCHEKTANVSARRQADESAGQQALMRARDQLEAHDYEGARATLRAMRRTHPLALTARENGILLMDSIDLAATRAAIRQIESSAASAASGYSRRLRSEAQQLPELHRRLRFYERKLQHDHRQRKSHD